MNKPKRRTPQSVKKATRELIRRAGGPSYLADVLRIPHRVTGKPRRITPSAIRMWPNVPAEAVFEFCRHSMESVTPHEVRPDLYPNPRWRAPK